MTHHNIKHALWRVIARGVAFYSWPGLRYSAVSRGKFGHTSTMQSLDLYQKNTL